MKDDRVYLAHIRDALDRVAEYTEDGRDSFFRDRRTQDAVVRNLEIVGEAAKHLSSKAKEGAPHVPWKVISGMRDKLIHEYFGVNLEIVWQVVEKELPLLRRQIDHLLSVDPGA